MLCSISDKRDQQSMLHLLLGLKLPLKRNKKNQIPTAAAEAQSKTCKLSADWTPPTKPSSYCWVREEQRGIQEAASPSGGSQRKKRGGWEGRAPTYILNSSSVRYLWAPVRHYAYKPSVNYFPDGRKIAGMGLALQSTCKGVWWGERVVALALKKPAIAPPGKKQRDYRGGGEEKTVSVFPQHISAAIGPREEARCLPATWAISPAVQGWTESEHVTSHHMRVHIKCPFACVRKCTCVSVRTDVTHARGQSSRLTPLCRQN